MANSTKKAVSLPRRRWMKIILLWGLLSLAFGAIQLGEPFDKHIYAIRSEFQKQPVSGDIVIVGIDDKSLQNVGRWPWHRDYTAKLFRGLDEAGAKKIVFDVFMEGPNEPGTAALLKEVERSNAKIYFATAPAEGDVNSGEQWSMPFPELRAISGLAYVGAYADTWDRIWSVRRFGTYDGKRIAGLSTILSDTEAEVPKLREGAETAIDQTFDANSFPYISAGDVIVGNYRGDLSGKNVVIAPHSLSFPDIFSTPLAQRIAGGRIQALGAETIKEGGIRNIGWLPSILVAAIAVFLFAKSRGPWGKLGAVALGIVLPIVGPIALEANGIVGDYSAGIFMFVSMSTAIFMAQRRARSEVREKIHVDTGLPNKRAMVDMFARKKNAAVADLVAVARLQNVSEIIALLDTNGREEFFRQLARRISVSNSDEPVFALAHDAIVWRVIDGELADASDYARAIRTLFLAPILVGSRSFRVEAVFGFDQQLALDLSERISAAAMAAEQAAAENSLYALQTVDRIEQANLSVSIKSDLAAAIESHDIDIVFQPKLDLETNRIVGAESLLRWNHPELGVIPPTRFVDVAEHNGDILPLTLHSLRRSIEEAKRLQQIEPEFSIAVNLSPVLLNDNAMVDAIIAEIESANFDPSKLTCEITESAEFVDFEKSVRLLESLKEAGVQISIDDYGTGLSTLEYLRALPADELKLDRAFVSGVVGSAHDIKIVNSSILLGQQLGMKVVAEGVETAEQIESLKQMNCDFAQGYFIGKPTNPRLFAKFLRGESKINAA